ncbi:MAG TPA: hypothetical protein VLX92_01055 [Kofleriaceae bacterium]|nr:hypothetical protein [Kofleriaceae bacterium]
MRKLALGALITGLFAACGGGGSSNKIKIVDSNNTVDMAATHCNVLAQTGCTADAPRCTWFEDDTSQDPPLGHTGCAPDTGTVDVGGACMYGAAGATGYDNCKKGLVCEDAICKTICDDTGSGAPMCGSNFACVTYVGLFTDDTMPPAGVCDPSCDPFADNNFGKTTKTGTTCGSANGCYGYPSFGSAPSTSFSCAGEGSSAATLVNRSPCTSADKCMSADGTIVYVNGCAQGFEPVLLDAIGSMQADCVSLCQPADCYSGNCGGTTAATSNLGGSGGSDRQCNNTDSSGTFSVSTPGAYPNGTNGDQCRFMWSFEEGSDGTFLSSPYSDKVGFCENHSDYMADWNGDGVNDGQEPKCDTFSMPTTGTGSAVGAGSSCTGANGCLGASDFGCVSTTTGGIMFQNNKQHAIHMAMTRPRMPYAAMRRQMEQQH